MNEQPLSWMKEAIDRARGPNVVESIHFLNEVSRLMSASRQMPAYRCHKIVHALKIAALNRNNEDNPNSETDGSAMMTPAENGYAPFKLDAAFMHKHKPEVGGYYVVYDDGYVSFSPSKAFEEGYSPTKGGPVVVDCPDCGATLKIVGDKLELVKHRS